MFLNLTLCFDFTFTAVRRSRKIKDKNDINDGKDFCLRCPLSLCKREIEREGVFNNARTKKRI